MSSSQERKIMELLSLFSIINVDSGIVRKAAYFYKKYQSNIADGIIAATSFIFKRTLVTRNIKHFRKIKEIKVKSI